MTTNRPKCNSVLVTGGGRGIGAAISKRMAADGRQVAVNYLHNGGAAEQLCKEIQAAGGEAVPVQGDVTDPGECERIAAEAARVLDGLDAVINNVGQFCWRPLTEMSAAEWDVVIKSNLTSAFYMFRAADPYLRRSKAPSFVTVGLSPADGVRAATNVGAYAIAKLGIQMFTRTLAAEIAGTGIRANCVAPGLIDNGHLPQAQREWMARRVPSGRLGSAEDIAAAVSFLIGDEALYINGATLAVSGAWDWLDRDATHDGLVHETFMKELKL